MFNAFHKQLLRAQQCLGQLLAKAYGCVSTVTVCEKVVLSLFGKAHLPMCSMLNKRVHWKVSACLLAIMTMMPLYAMTPVGTVISNTAVATFDVGGSIAVTENSNTVNVTSTIIRTQSTIGLLQYSPTTATITEEAPTQCRNGSSGPFIPSANPAFPDLGVGMTVLDPTTPLTLAPATIYNSSDPVFVQLDDADQNIDSMAVDTVEVTVSSTLGDSETILLSETDVDTGTFVGYVQTTENAVTAFNCELSVGPDSSVEASYTDPVDGTDSAVGATLVDPFGIVFNSLSGDAVDGITVRLINEATGQPAIPGVDVFGNDGVSAFPNTLVTGSTATDSGGTVYNFPTGGYRFPLLLPGQYRLEVVPTVGFLAPSNETIAQLQTLPAAPYALLADASFAQPFTLNPGPPLHVDLPIDPIAVQLVVNKTSLRNDAGIGDFIAYRVTVDNVDTLVPATGVIVNDTLPQGFRYQAGSARLDGATIADPAIAANGRGLQFSTRDLAPGESLTLRYVVEVTAGTPLGEAINSASATDLVGATSNVAQAVIDVRDEFLREKNILVGRVISGNCPVVKGQAGSSDIRLSSQKRDDVIEYAIDFSVTNTYVSDYQIAVKLPAALTYQQGSVELDGHSWGEPEVQDGQLLFKFDDRKFSDVLIWQHQLVFKANVLADNYGRYETEAVASMGLQSGIRKAEVAITRSTPVVRNVLLRSKPQYDDKEFVFYPAIASTKSELNDLETKQLLRIIDMLNESDVHTVSLEGYISDKATDALSMNTLKARTAALAPYFQAALGLQEEQISVGGFNDLLAFEDAAISGEEAQAIDAVIKARAKIKIKDEFNDIILADSGTLQIGLPAVDDREPAKVAEGLPGVEGVRIYLEDGSYVITDENGKYHFEDLRPGTHVVQLDLESLPSNMQIVNCEENTRFAGTPYSRFIDLKPGSLWRADFHVEEKPPAQAKVSLQMQTQIGNDALQYRLQMTGGEIPASNYRITMILPKGVTYIAGSSRIDGEAIPDPQVSDTILIYRLGDFAANWQHALTLDAYVGKTKDGRLASKAAAMFDTETDKGVRIPPVETVALVEGRRVKPNRYVFQPSFGTLSAKLSTADKLELQSIFPALIGSDVRGVRVIGHTDSVPISAAGRTKFKDNYVLSKARASSVARYLQESLGLEDNEVTAEGMGPDQPLADNATEVGRAQNRRTEILIDVVETVGADVSEMVQAQSAEESVIVQGKPLQAVPVLHAKKPPTPELNIEQFNKAWLDRTQAGVEWLMPADDFVPPIPAVNIAIKHDPQDVINGKLNGEKLNPLFYFGLLRNESKTIARSYWQGIHIKEGPNKFEFSIVGQDGKVKEVLERVIYFSESPIKAELVEEYSYLVADGKTPPVLAVKFTDEWGQAVRPGIVGDFAVLPPYQSKERLDSMEEDLLAAYDRNQPVYEIQQRGIAYIELEPTTQTGKVELNFAFNKDIEQTVEAWLKPAKRDWIVVGVADAVVGHNSISGNVASAENNGFEDGAYNDSKLAFFAKGNVGDDWLLTTAVDTSKDEESVGNSLFQTRDPDDNFTLYGDNTEQRYEAASAEKVFVKAEKDNFYAMFGDYDTGLNQSELSQYGRNVTGVKSEYNSEKLSVNAFATETEFRFVKDEIQGDGTSGLYRLSRNDIVLNSETITLETRDRFRSQDILESRILRRHYDYNIDYQAGTVFFKEPVLSRDLNFNPIIIVIDYETNTDIEGDITAGARAELKLADNKAQVAVTAISDGTFGADGDLYGTDIRIQTSDTTELKVEYASSDVNDAGTQREGDAYIAEFKVHGRDLDGRVYAREQDAGFGLGQQAGSESGTRKYGVDGSYQINDMLRVNSEVYHEDNLNTEASRDVIEADLSATIEQNTFMVGIRNAKDEQADGTESESQLLLVGASTKLADGKLLIRANSEIDLGSDAENPAYPTRHIQGLEYSWTRNFVTYIENETTQGQRQDTRSVRAGIRATPWSQMQIDSSVEEQTGEYGPRTFAVLGLTQGVRLNERWSGDVSYDQSKTMRDGGGNTELNLNVPPPSSGTFSNDFSAVSLGATRRGDSSTWVNRLEQRDSDSEDRFGAIIGWHRDLQEGIAFGVDMQLFDSTFTDNSERSNGDLRFSLAYRPITSKWIHLNRLDYKYDIFTSATGESEQSRRWINNWKGNYLPSRHNQFAFSYGIKYVLDSIDDDDYDGITHYIGTEYRHDISRHWDLGVHISTLRSANAGNALYSYGVSAGWDFAKNVWLSVGYNFDGFSDDDFSLAEYTAKGPFVKMRFKFDQYTFKKSNR